MEMTKTNVQDAAHAITSSYLMLNLLLCGFYLRIPDMTLSFYKGLTWATFAKYTFQGLAINELKDRQWDLSSCSQTNPGRTPGAHLFLLLNLCLSILLSSTRNKEALRWSVVPALLLLRF